MHGKDFIHAGFTIERFHEVRRMRKRRRDHTVTAMVPGQPNSKQTIEKRAVASGGVVAVEFTF